MIAKNNELHVAHFRFVVVLLKEKNERICIFLISIFFFIFLSIFFYAFFEWLLKIPRWKSMVKRDETEILQTDNAIKKC